MAKDKKPTRKGPTKYRTPSDFRREIQRRNPALDQRRKTPITQHRG